MTGIGDNNPPDMATTAGEVTKYLSGWMAEHPTIETEEQARAGKIWADRAYLCLKDMDDERIGRVKPLNEKVKEINLSYRGPCDLLSGVMHELKSRIDRFLRVEENKRNAIAEEAAKVAQEAEQAARAAEQREREASADADTGVLGVDIADIQRETNEAYARADKAMRQATFADRETKVKVGGGFRRAVSLRNFEAIHIADAMEVLNAVGFTEGIKTELLKAARAYKRLKGEYPPGITVTIERGI